MALLSGSGLGLSKLTILMPRSSPAELSALREEVFTRDEYRCRWPGCSVTRDYWGNPPAGLQLAHLTHRGMGGSKVANTSENCVTLCSVHHDCLDGRTGLGTLRLELNQMLRSVVGITVDTP